VRLRLAIGSIAAIVLAAACVAGVAHAAATRCSSIAVTTPGAAGSAFSYRIEVSTGTLDCGAARSILRSAVTRPIFNSGPVATFDGWKCTLGASVEPWIVSCARGGVVARADGPEVERDPWLFAAASLTMPVLEPTAAPSLGFVLRGVRPRGKCSNTVPEQEVVAGYGRSDGATIRFFESRPPCGNLGVAPVLAHWRIHGHPAALLEYCTGPLGCSRTTGEYALHWQERGNDMTIVTHGVRQTELLALARSLAVVIH
jgi:hypothetical protein